MSTRAGGSTQTLTTADNRSLHHGRMHSARLATAARPQPPHHESRSPRPNPDPSSSQGLPLPQTPDLPPSSASDEPAGGDSVQPRQGHDGGHDNSHDDDADGHPSEGHPNDGNVETQSPQGVSPEVSSGASDSVWDCSIEVPGSRNNKKIYFKAPFEWGQWTREQWQDRFVFVKKELEALVHKYLRLRDFESRPVYSPRMVGTSPSDARPSVVVTCREVDFKNIRALFHSRAEGPLCLGRERPSTIWRSHLRPPFGHQQTRRDEPTIPRLLLVYYRTRTPPVIRLALELPLLAYLRDDGASCGGILRYGQRSATVGITLGVGDHKGILTVDHLFSQETRTPAVPTLSDSFSFDSDRSRSPTSVDFDRTDSDTPWEEDDEYEDLELDEPPEPAQIASLKVPMHSPQEADPSVSSPPKEVHHQTDEAAQHFEEWNLLASSAQLAPSAAYLDWALAWPTSTESNISLALVNTIFPEGPSSEGILLEAVQEHPPAHLAAVYVVSGIRGVLHGQILSSPSYLPSPSGGDSCEAWTVILDASYGEHP